MLTQQEKKSAHLLRRSNLPERIILTGFRATGKSAVGSMLAERLGLEFIDTDARLCDGLDCSIADYVCREGWAAFRQREQELLEELAGVHHAVISTGGGAVLHADEWNRLRKNSLVVWLQADIATIRYRMKQDETNDDQRPPLTDNGNNNEVEEILAARSPLYLDGSDMSVDTAAMTPGEIVTMIEREISTEFSS